MKRSGLLITALLTLIIQLATADIYAQWQQDNTYGFRIKLPNDWSKKSYMDGTDKVYDYYSPDENAAVQLRVFEAGGGVTTDLLVQVYEENMLPQGTHRESLNDHVSANGIPGKHGMYMLDYDGNGVFLSAFYTVQNNNAYVLTAIIPSVMLEQKGEEVKEITRSFILDGFNAPQQTEVETNNDKPKGLNGLLGSTGSDKDEQPDKSSYGSTPGDISGRYTFISRSDGPSRTNYHYIDIRSNGTYSEKYQPKNSGNYEGGHDGTWSLNGNQLRLTHQGGSYSDSYVVSGNELKRTIDSGIVITFRK